MKSFKKQAGFTLIEIAIVLVIVGLLLAGVLKGQEMIENGRVKAAANDLNGVAAAYSSYLDRYKRLPGDDGLAPALVARGAAWAGMAAGDVNGVIAAPAATAFNPAGTEAEFFFRHLRAAGFLAGNPADVGLNALPTNAWGGRTTVVSAAVQGRPAARFLVCMGSVPGKSAAALDVQLDDGRANQGSLRATLGANNIIPGVAPAAYNEDQTYTVCRDL